MSEIICKETALIIDDEIHVCEYMRCIVKSIGFKNIYATTNSAEATQLCQDLKPMLILLDINMPHCTGIEVLERIHRYQIDSIIIMMTTINAKEYIEICIQYGARNYILKNQETDRIVNIIRSTLNNSGIIFNRNKSNKT